MNNGQQTRGTFKVKFNDLQEEITLFEYVSIVYVAEIKYKYLYLLSFSENTLIKRDSSNSKTILATNNPMPLKKISISFRKSYKAYLGIGLADEWSFRSVTVLDMQSNIRYYINT